MLPRMPGSRAPAHLYGNGSLLQHHGGGIVGHGPDHVEVAGGAAGQVAAQVGQGHEGVPQQAHRLPHQVDDALVLLAPLRLPMKGARSAPTVPPRQPWYRPPPPAPPSHPWYNPAPGPHRPVHGISHLRVQIIPAPLHGMTHNALTALLPKMKCSGSSQSNAWQQGAGTWSIPKG